MKILCVIYVTFVVSIFLTKIGNTPECTNSPYSFTTMILASSLIIAPAILGYAAGLKDGENTMIMRYIEHVKGNIKNDH